MDLHQLLERMGEATLEEAAAMRDVLVEKYDGQDTRDIPEDEWRAAFERAIERAISKE